MIVSNCIQFSNFKPSTRPTSDLKHASTMSQQTSPADAVAELTAQCDDCVASGTISKYDGIQEHVGSQWKGATATISAPRGEDGNIKSICVGLSLVDPLPGTKSTGFFIVGQDCEAVVVYDTLMSLCLKELGEAAQNGFGDALAAQLAALVAEGDE